MKRRKFIKSAAFVTAGAIGMPYILPSGRLFASSGSQMVEHVVYVLFAGGVRQQEGPLQLYLAQSQGLPNVEGNILINMMNGAQPTTKVVYGTTPFGQPDGSQPIAQLLGQTIQSQGTYFPEVNFSQGGTGHYYGLSAITSGNYGLAQGLRKRPIYPTIMEYVRRHAGAPASKVWFVGNGIGNSTPLLNYSDHPSYGLDYGANFLAPTVTFSRAGKDHLNNAKVYHPEEQLEPIYEMKTFLDNVFQAKSGVIPGINNTDEEKQEIKTFIDDMFQKQDSNSIAFPPVNDSDDAKTIGYTCEVLERFNPTLTVVNMNSIDDCHTDFSGYLKAMHRCDHNIGHLWNFIQNDPVMANNTAMILIPEHGRSYDPNPILDINDWNSYDHNSDPNARRVFSMMVGPGIQAGLKVGSESNPIGDSADPVLTIGELLGIKSDIMSAGLVSPTSRSFFDRI